jgi:predicted nuclease of predicted toxin-antitoxin system
VRFLIDASLPHTLTELLADNGHFGAHASDTDLGAAPDRAIAGYARRNGYAILTADFDFADIRECPPREYAGIAVLTLPRFRDMLLISMLVSELLVRIEGSETIQGKLAVVEVGRIRIRS